MTLKSTAMFWLFGSISMCCLAQTRPIVPEPAPVLLELFTSEGCSSCPPADALLRSLNGTKSASGQLLIALSEHVTYWNRLGWEDPFSSERFTERQNAYGERFHLDSVYTPQMVINGSAQVVGSNRDGIESAIKAQRTNAPALTVRILSSSLLTGSAGQGKLSVTFSVAQGLPEGGVDIFAVVADDLQKTEVLRGENGGRTLAHVSVARSLVRLGHLDKPTESQQATVPLSQDKTVGAGKQHLVLFAQQPHLGAVLGLDSQPIQRQPTSP